MLINDKYPEQSYVKTIVDWAWSDENSRGISNESVRLMAKVLLWLLTSVNRKLRDSATKALICLLKRRASVLVKLIPEFANVNDPYVSQRLFAVAYGCAICNNDRKELKEIGDAVFEAVFKDEEVKPDILLRDYARQVIEYGVYNEVTFSFDLDKIRPPYKSSLPNTFPSNEEIDKFRFSYDAPGFEKQYGSQNSILSSMVTEYGRGTGGYGDFGRYVFEYGFTGWEDNIDVNGLSNLGVKWIIEKYGYDVNKHGMFDRSLNYNNSAGRRERIGKKYQWIVFHELLARVADNVEYDGDKYSENPIKRKYQGPWELAVRDIDPTFTIKETPDNIECRHWWYTPPRISWGMENQAWTKVTDDFPDPLGLIAVKDQEGVEWLVLEMLPKWDQPPKLGHDHGDKPHKDLWYQIRSYLVRSSEYDAITAKLQGKNFYGRWMPEARQDSDTFSREFFWSPAYVGNQSDYRGEIDWEDIVDRNARKVIGTVACTTLPFAWTAGVDESKESSIRFFKPSRLLHEILDLKYSPTEGELLGRDGKIVALDPGTTQTCLSCLVVRKDELLKTLKENSLNMFWTVLGGKRILGGNSSDHTESTVVSGVITFGANGLTYTSSFFKR